MIIDPCEDRAEDDVGCIVEARRASTWFYVTLYLYTVYITT